MKPILAFLMVSANSVVCVHIVNHKTLKFSSCNNNDIISACPIVFPCVSIGIFVCTCEYI